MREIFGTVKTIEKDKNYRRLNVVVEDFSGFQYYIQVMEKKMVKVNNLKEGDIVRFEVEPVLKKVERGDMTLYFNNLVFEEATREY